MRPLRLIECPRDAMQGIHHFIPTDKKIQYLNALLQVGFDTLDFGSFVSPKAIPQMRDTADVLSGLALADSQTQLLAIVANERGAEDALRHPQIAYLGFPLSLSETFQQRNTNRSIADAYTTVANIAALCVAESRQLVVYLSMGFGNPYGDAWNVGIVEAFTARLVELGIGIISLADTVGTAVAADITPLYQTLTTRYPTVEIGAHFHANPTDWESKIAAAYQGGCRRFDGALKGYGGCPYAKDELVGNIATENLIRYFRDQNEPAALQLNDEALAAALALVMPTFAEHHPTT